MLGPGVDVLSLLLAGSGKSYTMMGTADNKGLIPRLCDTLFERIAASAQQTTSHKVEVSYMEIYNEKVRPSPFSVCGRECLHFARMLICTLTLTFTFTLHPTRIQKQTHSSLSK